MLEAKGISENEMEIKLMHEAELSLIKAKNYVIANNVDWRSVDDRLKYALADYCFNVGNLKGFPTTSKCLMFNPNHPDE